MPPLNIGNHPEVECEVLFLDFDHTLVDSSALVENTMNAALKYILEKNEINLSDDVWETLKPITGGNKGRFLVNNGYITPEIFRDILAIRESLLPEVIESLERPFDLLPGVSQLLNGIPENVATAIITNSSQFRWDAMRVAGLIPDILLDPEVINIINCAQNRQDRKDVSDQLIARTVEGLILPPGAPMVMVDDSFEKGLKGEQKTDYRISSMKEIAFPSQNQTKKYRSYTTLICGK